MGNYLKRVLDRRLNRSTYAISMVLTYFVYTPLLLVGLYFFLNSQYNTLPPYLTIIVLYLFLLPHIVLSHRRYHDLGKEGYAVQLSMVWKPELFGQEGQPETNEYGDPPKPGIDWKGLFGF
jgi:uncharacterized membrane protein YhaH (DUF805 family)